MTTALDRPPEEAAEDTSLARGLRIFLTIADRGEIRADELSTLLETPLSTVYRYLRTLTEFGFIERQEGGYRLGSRLHVLGAGRTVTAEELIRASDPVLASLAETSGETAFVSRRIGLGAVSLAEHPSAHPLRVVPELGLASPLTVGAVALVLLAYAPEEVQDAALAEVEDPTRTAIRGRLTAVASDAYAYDDDETFPSATTMAVPVLSDDGIVAAVGLSAPTDRANRRWQARARGGLRRAAAAIEEELRSGDRA
jgi:IclR family acetate operon transcriptional repressor